MRLSNARIEEIIGTDGLFKCHKTVKWDNDDNMVGDPKVCAGWITFHMRQATNKMAGALMRIHLHMNTFGSRHLDNQRLVFENKAEMKRKAI